MPPFPLQAFTPSMTRWLPTPLPPAWGLDAARCAAALATYQTTGMRQHIVEKGGVTFIEDCYNASPDSMRAALSVLKALPNTRKIALLGDMLELGDASEDGHRHTGEWAADAGVDQLIAYGPRSAGHGRRRKSAWYCNCALPKRRRSVTISTAIRAPPVTQSWPRPATPWGWSSCFRISIKNCRRGKGLTPSGKAVRAAD